MNLRRGLLRLWVVFSMAWIIAVGVHAYSVWPKNISNPWAAAYRSVGPAPDLPEKATTEEILENLNWLGARPFVRPHLEWALGPPVAVLIIGGALSWAIAGFRRE